MCLMSNLSITTNQANGTKEFNMPKKKIPLVPPGEIIRQDFLEPLEISAYRLAMDTGMSQTRVKEILDGNRGITADTALRLGRFFGSDPQWWINMQTVYDLQRAQEESGAAIERAVRPWQHAA